MSADVIQANYASLDAIASHFSQQANAVDALDAQVKRGVEALENGGWEGKGSTAFFAELHGELFPALQRLRQVLDEARAVTLEAKAIMERAEQEAAALFQNTKDGGGSGNVNAAPNKGLSVMDVVHGALDVAGFVPGLGAVPDIINAGIYAIEGDFGNAAMSGIAAVPIIGDAIKGVDKARDVAKVVDKLDDIGDAARAVDTADDARDAAKMADAIRDRAKQLDDVDGGHSIGRHGPEVPDSKLQERLTTGYTPDGKFSPAPASTRFRSYEDWERTRQSALDKFARDNNVDLSKPPGSDAPPRYDPVFTDHPAPIGDGFKGVDPVRIDHPNRPGKQATVYQNTEPINNLTRTQTTVEWNAELGRWVVAQHIPIR